MSVNLSLRLSHLSVTCARRAISRSRHVCQITSAGWQMSAAKSSAASMPPIDLFDQNGAYQWKVNLSLGAPSQEQLAQCVDVMRQATDHRLRYEQEKGGHIFNYGVREGDHGFRQELAKFLTERYDDPVDPYDLITTSGASHGFYTVGSLMMPPGSVIFIEDPSYFIAIQMIRSDFGFKIVSVPMDGDGIIVEELERLVKEHCVETPTHTLSNRYPYRAMAYIIPTYHNPTGCSLSPERCQRLVELGRKYDLLLFCDDIYNLLPYRPDPARQPSPGQPARLIAPPRLYAYDRKTHPDYKGSVVSNGTFSKIFGPGLRLGWMEAPEVVLRLIVESGFSGSGGSFNNYTSGVMCSMLETGLMTRHIRQIRAVNASRMAAVCRVLRDGVPPSVRFVEPQGGYFVWIELPPGKDASQLLEITRKEHSVSFQVGNNCSSQGNFKNCLRICIAFYDEETLVDATQKLAASIKDFVD